MWAHTARTIADDVSRFFQLVMVGGGMVAEGGGNQELPSKNRVHFEGKWLACWPLFLLLPANMRWCVCARTWGGACPHKHQVMRGHKLALLISSQNRWCMSAQTSGDAWAQTGLVNLGTEPRFFFARETTYFGRRRDRPFLLKKRYFLYVSEKSTNLHRHTLSISYFSLSGRFWDLLPWSKERVRKVARVRPWGLTNKEMCGAYYTKSGFIYNVCVRKCINRVLYNVRLAHIIYNTFLYIMCVCRNIYL